MMAFERFENCCRWVAWRNEPRNDSGKLTKVPYAPSSGQRAKSDDPNTWGSRFEAEALAGRIVNGQGGGIGIMLGDLGDGTSLVGVDLDTCRNPATGLFDQWAIDIAHRFSSYTEISPSGTGAKIFALAENATLAQVRADTGIKHGKMFKRGNDADHPPAIELYLSNRNFTVTGWHTEGGPTELALIPPEPLLWLLNEYGPIFVAKIRPTKSTDDSRSAIAFRKGIRLRQAGSTFQQMCSALRDDPETASWYTEKGISNNCRELERIWDKAGTTPVAKSAKKREISKHDCDLNIGSDVEIARLVADDLRQQFGNVLFDGSAFYRWTGQYWGEIDEDTMRRAVYAYDGALFPTADDKLSSVKLNKSRINSVLFEMRTMLAERGFFDQPAFGINCKSGFIVFDATGVPTLLPHSPEHRCRHVLPGGWNPGTLFDRPPENSLLSKMLIGCFKGDDDEREKRQLVEEIAGAVATGYSTKLIHPKAVILVGEGADNGKSQFLDIMRGLLPPSAISSVSPSSMGDERHIIGLIGKLLNASDEFSSRAIASERFKKVVTGEPVDGRDVYKSRVEFRSIALNIFSGNILPNFSGGIDRGVRRRLLVVRFNRTIPEPEKIKDIGVRIAQEEPNLLLAMAVSGATRLIRQKYFTIPPSSETALAKWIFDSDPIPAWVEGRVEQANVPKPDDKIVGIRSSVAYDMFREWARSEGFKEYEIPNLSGFVQRLQAESPWIVVKHTKSGNWLLGLTILATDRDPARDGIAEGAPWSDPNKAMSGWRTVAAPRPNGITPSGVKKW